MRSSPAKGMTAPMISELTSFLLTRSGEWKFPPGGEWKFLFHNNYQPHYSGINLLWFRDRDEFPRVVTKVCRDPGILQKEYENLNQLHADIPGCTPRPLHFGQLSGFWTLWMSGVPGRRFQVRAEYSPDTLRSITETVISIHAATRRQAAVDDNRLERMVSQPLDTLFHFGKSLAVQNGCQALAEKISSDWIKSLPVIPQHGDLYLGNLLANRGRWHVVDWESFGVIDLPLYDLFTFCFSLLQIGANTPETWRPSIAAEVPALVFRYSQEFSLAHEDLKLLLPLTLVNWFHLQWMDGREEFSTRMYRVIEHYFQNSSSWDRLVDVSSEKTGERQRVA